MTDNHPITPPPELVQQWAELPLSQEEQLVVAARWGADQELEACCEALARELICDGKHVATDLRSVRRPKSPSLSEPALQALVHLDKGAESQMDTTEAVYTIRRALERLQELEGNG